MSSPLPSLSDLARATRGTRRSSTRRSSTRRSPQRRTYRNPLGFRLPSMRHIAVCCCVGAVTLMGIGFTQGKRSLQLHTEGQSVQGVVSEITLKKQGGRSKKGGSKTAERLPVFSYTVGTETYSCEAEQSFFSPSYRSGQKVSLLYLPDTPELAYPDSFTELDLAPLASLTGGLLLLGAGILIFFNGRRKLI